MDILARTGFRTGPGSATTLRQACKRAVRDRRDAIEPVLSMAFAAFVPSKLMVPLGHVC